MIFLSEDEMVIAEPFDGLKEILRDFQSQGKVFCLPVESRLEWLGDNAPRNLPEPPVDTENQFMTTGMDGDE